MNRIPPPKEPSGCLQTLTITRVIAGILAVPLLLIFGGIACLVLALYAFAESPFLGFAVIVIAAIVLLVVARWEYTRAKRGLPPMDDPADPRMR